MRAGLLPMHCANELPVVINTAYSSYKENFLSWSADAYLTKSADLSELKGTIRSILEAGRAAQPAC